MKTARPVLPPASRKTLLEWIDLENGDTTDTLAPSCSTEVQALHAKILVASDGRKGRIAEPLQPPPGLWLAPLG